MMDIIEQLARQDGTTPKSVFWAMQECLDAAWATSDSDIKAKQREIFGDTKPSVEEFIRRLAELAAGNPDLTMS